jgi:hypothetical protein
MEIAATGDDSPPLSVPGFRDYMLPKKGRRRASKP